MTSGISIQNVSAGYRDKDVLHGVSLDAPAGTITALLGPNGSGKSTLLKSILGLTKASGSIRVNGRDLAEMSPVERAQQIAYVPQRTQLMARLSVEEVVEMGRFAHRGPLALRTDADREAVAQAMESAGVSALSNRSFLELSGGERQRVLLARALATGAKTLLLDEPTSALDVRQVLSIHHVLRGLAEQGCCILVVLHGLLEARQYAERAILLQEGRVHEFGPVEYVLRPEAVQEVYGVQMKEGPSFHFSIAEKTS